MLYCSHKAGLYSNNKALLYSMSVFDTKISGAMIDEEKNDRDVVENGMITFG